MAAITEVRRASNLPADVTSFVGRRRELTEVRRLLSAARLVTLTGVGGVGKTRLATRAAADLRRVFTDGVWLVELAASDNGDLVPDTIAATLGIRNQSARPTAAVLADYLADKHLLLVLDNCEHLLDACARLATELLRAAPELRILATSRHALRVSGEHTLVVSPLPVVDPGAEADLADSDAARLFADRGAAVRPGFAITAENARTVAGLCHRLDGIPLAIELAAVRLQALPVEQISARLHDRFRLLTTGGRAGLEHQRTLQAVFDWSFELCSPAERALWERLSVFSGSFALEAAEEICAGDDLPHEDILDLVSSLVDKSILIQEQRGPEARYRLLETVRDYGRNRLRKSGDQAPQQRHRDYYQQLAEQAEAQWFGPDQQEWFARLRSEQPNLRAALEYCCTEPGQPQAGLQMAAALRMFWIHGGCLIEGRRWLDRLLDTDTKATTARTKALWVDSWITTLHGDLNRATTLVEESRALADELDQTAARAYIASVRGLIAVERGDWAAAATAFEEAISQHRANNDRTGLTYSLGRRAHLAVLHEDLDTGVPLLQECLAISEAAHEHWYRTFTLWVYGIAMWRQGDYARAIELERESIRLKKPFGDTLGTAYCTEALAWIAATTGEPERAAILLGGLEQIWPATGMGAQPVGRDYTEGHEQCVAAARTSLGGRAYDAAYRRGSTLTPDQAIAYALEEKTTSESSRQAKEVTVLTRREWDVAKLVAAGLSNQQIAAKLVISKRTAETHVENILIKLGLSSRAQIATWVTRHESS